MHTKIKWIVIPLVSVLLAWAADRLRTESRLTAVEQSSKDIIDRLGRIEDKIDKFLGLDK